MENEGSPPEPALRPEINLFFVLPVHRPKIERLPAAVKVKNASFRWCRSRFDPGEVHNSWRPTWGEEALRRGRPRPSWSDLNGSPTGQEALRRRPPRPSWSAQNESPTNQGKATLDAQQLAPNVVPRSAATASTTPVAVGFGRNMD